MEYININNNLEPRPRYLTDQEIDLILNQLPNVYGVDEKENENIKQSINSYLRDILKNKKIAPNGIQNLANQIVKQYTSSKIAAGSTVGTATAEATACGPTQAALDSHRSQSKAGGGGINEVEELFYAKKNRKNEICTIHYKDKTLSYEQVLDTKKDIEGCMFSQFIKDYLYIKEGDKYVKDCIIDTYDNLPKKWWHDEFYLNQIKSKIPNPQDYVLRINLSLKEMYKYKVSIKDLVDVFKRENDSAISVLYGPMQDAIIDVYACANFVENKKGIPTLEAVKCTSGNDIVTASFYQTIIQPSLDNLRIKGIAGISGLTPLKIPLVSAILTDEDVSWMLYKNYEKNYENNIIKLFELLGINVIKNTKDSMLLSMPKFEDYNIFFTGNFVMERDDFLQLNPIEYVDLMLKIDKKNNPKSKQKNLNLVFSSIKNSKVDKINIIKLSKKKMKSSGISIPLLEKLFNLCGMDIIEKDIEKYNPELLIKYHDYDLLKDEIKNKLTNKNYRLITPRALISSSINIDNVKKASEIVYAEVIGTNLKGLLSLPFLDKTRLRSNNVHVVASVYGNRAAKKIFLDEVYELLSPFSVSPQHMLLLADLFFSRGVPTGAMYNSVNKQLGPVDKATVSKAVEIFKTSSLHGINHDISGVSTHIAFGVAPKIGTGYFDIAYNGKNKVSVNNEVYTAFKNEQAYLDRQAKEIIPVVTNNPNQDLRPIYEKDEIKKISSQPLPRGKKVKLDFQEPTITIPVSKYEKVSKYSNITEKEITPNVPVSRYAKKVVKEEEEEKEEKEEEKEEKEEEKEEIEKPIVPVSRYAKSKTIKNQDISVKSRKAKK